MSHKEDAIKVCKIIMKKKFGVSIPHALLAFTYDLTQKFAQDPGNRQVSPSKLSKEITINKKIRMVSSRMTKRLSNVA